MELRVLRYVVTVADAGSIMAAADRLHLTQPSLSRQIRALESELRFEIFTRGSGALRPSPAGRRFLPLARDLVSRADATIRAAAAIAYGRLGEVVIAATATTLTDVLAPFVATLDADAPWPAVRPTPSDEVYASLRQGADLAVAPHRIPDGLTGLVVADLPVLAQVAPGHPWAGRGHLPLDELVEARLLLQRRTAHSRQYLDLALAREGLVVAIAHEFDSSEVAMAVAASGRGVAVVTDDPRYGLVPLHIDTGDGPLVFSLRAAWDPQHQGAGEIEALAHGLRAFCAMRYGSPASP